MNNKPFTIALDGPAAAGKGTIARAIAALFGVPYLDTGLLYRAVGNKVTTGLSPVEAALTLSENDLKDEARLRTREAGEAASQVAAIPEVRAALLEFQRKFARRAGGAVLDGRDIGTVICPEADVKFFVTASDDVRAKRRFDELAPSKPELTIADVLADLKKRDARDAGRQDAPMKQAADALLLDTTNLSIDAAVAKAVRHIEEKRAK